MERKATMMSAMLAASAIASSAAAPPKVENGKIEPVPAVEVNARRGVGNFIAKLEAGKPVTVAYLGGSITEMSGWRNMTTDWLRGMWPEAKMVPVDESMLVGGGWTKLGADDPEQKSFAKRGGQFWRADRPGAKLSFRFCGTKCGIYDLLAPKGANVRVTVDGKVSRPTCPRFDAWCWYTRLATLWVFDGADGEHNVEIEVLAQQPDRTLVKREDVNTPKYDGTWFQPCQIMVVGEVVRGGKNDE